MKYGNYFLLNPECILIKGATRGAIYDLKYGNVYSIDSISMKILEKLEQKVPCMEVLKIIPEISREILFNYLIQLCDIGIGKFVSKDYVQNKVDIIKPVDKLNFVHLELTEKCNLRCKHCYKEGCDAGGKKELKYDDFVRILEESHKLGCKNIQFIGGEVFYRRDLLFSLILKSKEIGYEFIEIFSNGTLITDHDLNLIRNLNARLAISIYSNKEEIHDGITGKKGSWRETVKNLIKMVAKGISVRVVIVVMKQNEKDIKNTASFIQDEICVKNVKVDFVRPSGGGCKSDLSSESICESQKFLKPQFNKITFELFKKLRFGHNCFGDKICISAIGKVHPCIMERNYSYGDVINNSLADILLSETAKKFKGLSKDNVEVCKDCEYRYCCFDCRIKARMTNTENLYVKPWWCAYNPYMGEWNQQEKGGGHENL